MSFTYIYFEDKLVENAQTSIDSPLKSLNPAVRMGHVCVSYGKFLIMWGGRKHHNEEYVDRSKIWIFHTELEKWKSVQIEEDEHSPKQVLSGSYSILVNDSIYLFGGSSKTPNSFTDVYHNDLYELNLKTFKWNKLNPVGKLPSPRDKMSGWFHDNKWVHLSILNQRK
jgi:hypothetical protein